MNMNIKLEQLQKAVDDVVKAGDLAADYAAYAAYEAAYLAFCKAMKELKDYKKEHGL